MTPDPMRDANMRLAVASAGYVLKEPGGDKGGMFCAEGLDVVWEDVRLSDEVLVWCVVGSVPETPSSDLMNYLLQANCFGRQTGGGHLGLYAMSRTLVYSLRFVPNGNERDMAGVLQSFVARALQFLGKFQDLTSHPEKTPVLAEPMAGDSLRI